MNYLHHKNLMHRDLKSSNGKNIVICTDDVYTLTGLYGITAVIIV